MKQMEYKDYRADSEVLHKDVYEGYRYCIVSHGTHPCVYVALPEWHPYYGANTTGDIAIEVHGGVTYCGECPWLDMAYAIGWDYVHPPHDYFNPTGCAELEGGHKWTTVELDLEAHIAISQLKAIEETLQGQGAAVRFELRKIWAELTEEHSLWRLSVILSTIVLLLCIVIAVWAGYEGQLILMAANVINACTWSLILVDVIKRKP